MLTKHEFHKTCDTLGLEDHELDLAALIWQKAELAMQGKPTQTPALLKTKVKPTKFDKQPAVFSMQELQTLHSLLAELLTEFEIEKKMSRSLCSTLWDKCDKAQELTSKFYFKQLNAEKDRLRTYKEKSKKLSKIQRKIKYSMRTKLK